MGYSFEQLESSKIYLIMTLSPGQGMQCVGRPKFTHASYQLGVFNIY